MKPPRLTTPRLILRSPTPEDVPAIVTYLKQNRRHLAPWSPTFPTGFFTRKFWAERVRQAKHEWDSGTALRLYLFPKDDPKRIIGSINFTQIFRGPFQNTFLGYSIAADEQGKGLMTEALRAANKFVFGEMNLHRISANHMPTNVSSREVLRKLGFTVEGYARNYLLVNGIWEDHVLTTLVNPAWQAAEQEISVKQGKPTHQKKPATSPRSKPGSTKPRIHGKSGR